VHGERAKEALVESGHFPPDAIRIAGSPNIESARSQDERQAVRSRLGLAADAFVVLYFGAPLRVVPAEAEHLRTFLACCSTMPEIRPILRPHPSDQGGAARYRSAAAAAGIEAPVPTGEDPFHLILAADIVISHNSTTALDAMALERPVVHINMSGSPDLFRFVENGGALRATSADELRAALTTLREPDVRELQVRRQLAYSSRYYAQVANPARTMLEVGYPDCA
jgi:hypothetical protein